LEELFIACRDAHQLQRVMHPTVGNSFNNMIAIISYHVTHFFRNRRYGERKKSTARCDRLIAKSRPIRARNPCAFHRAILPVFPLTSKPAISMSPFSQTLTRTHTYTHTHTHIHIRSYISPRFIFHRWLSSTLFPFSRLTFFRVPPYQSRSLKPPAFP